ncbi:hypothetical protein UMZ34_09800 [Halopseudomonas pachastrellae]|nr:hypothetical protein UMZ34_09800 [Halopseudomonas pachastrellae]
MVLGIFLQPFVFLYVKPARAVLAVPCRQLGVRRGGLVLRLGADTAVQPVVPTACALIARRYDPAQPRRWYCRAWCRSGLYLLLMGLILGTRTYLYEPTRCRLPPCTRPA